jgi:hypothetical protein
VDFVSDIHFLHYDLLSSCILIIIHRPYTKAPSTLHIGSDGIVHYVPLHLLPAEWVKAGTQDQLHFPKIDMQTGHSIVNFLYKGTYETPATIDNSPSRRACTKLKAALLVYIATSDHDLPGLQQLAIGEIETHGSSLTIFEILGIIDAHFSRLRSVSWVHKYLHHKAKVAFEEDRTVFTNKELWQDLNNVALIRFMARSTVDVYNTKLFHMLGPEKDLSVVPLTKELSIEGYNTPEVEISVTTEDFCTISCPDSEFPDCEVKASLIDDTSGECQEGPEQRIEEVCEVIASPPIGFDINVDTDFFQVSADSRECPFQTNHMLRGKGWKACERCRETVRNLSVLSPDLGRFWSTERGM